MPDYTVSDAKLQELNVMIDQGGHIPSAVSDALADAQIAQAQGNDAALTRSLNRAIAANIQSGKAWSNVQNWHDSVKDSGNGGTTPPQPPQGPSPPSPFPNDGVRQYWGPMYANQMVTTQAGGDGRMEWSISSGNGYYKTWVNGALVVDGGMSPFQVKAGDKIDMMITTPASAGANGSIVNN